ncbi:MAG: hypothetical protein H7840_18130 [Alphaproteobacteria bacterium]
MLRYDPLKAPVPHEWTALHEAKRIRLVQDYHQKARIRLPNTKAHAIFHVIVENQIAVGDQLPIQRTVQRLMDEGLNRHDAIHAIGMVLAEHISNLVQIPEPQPSNPNDPYFAAIEELTAEKWLRG